MRVLVGLLREIPKWERATQVALLIAIIMLLIDLVILSTVPDLQTQAMIGAVGLLLAIQAIFMYGNRNMVTPYTKAQRHFMAGEFEQVVSVLKQYIEEEEHPVIDALVLLGNSYRNLGQLHESEAVLRIALARRKNYHFALYGVAKIRLAKGDYNEAIKHLETALNNGAPDVIRFDLAHTMLRNGNESEAIAIFREFTASPETFRALFAQYVLFVDGGEKPSSELIEVGLPFWDAEIQRFANTPYGEAIAEDIERIRDLL